MSGAKKYGLIIKKKPKENQIKKASVFGNDSSGEEDATSKRSNINVSLIREADKKKQMKQTQIEIEKAIREDPTVYEYDNVYDEMAEKKKAAIPKLIEKDKKPKYIENLLKSARSRKMEEERRIERKTHKEREEEGGEFQDKEEFVTSAYRKRMLELAEEEKQLKKKEALDAANDVTKRSDLTMFYSNLLRQNVSMGGAFEAHSQDASKDDKPDQENGPPSENKERTASDLRDNNSRSSSEHSKNSRTDRGNHSDSRSHREDNLLSRDKDNKRRNSSDEEHYRKRRDDDKERVDNRRESRKETESPRSESSRRPDSSSRKLDRHDSEKRHSSEERSRERDVKRKSDKDELKHAKKDEPEEEKQEIITSSKFSKRSNNETVSSARERFLERKRAREMALEHRPKEDSDED